MTGRAGIILTTDRQMIVFGSVAGPACTVVGSLILARVIEWPRVLGVLELLVGLLMLYAVVSFERRRRRRVRAETLL